MQIAICDDEKIFRNELKSLLVEYKKDRRLNLDIYEFANGESLFKNDIIFDMVFLDYQMPNLNGMETARKLREKNAFCSIVFVTNYPDFVLESFEVNPYRFFVKPLTFSMIENLLNSYIIQRKKLAPLIINDYDGQKIVESKDIIYLEGEGKYCVVRTNLETLHSSKTLSAVFDLLPQYCFYRVHKSYVVNLYCIQRINNNEITLTNGEKVVISRNKIADFKKAYKNFVKDFYLNL